MAKLSVSVKNIGMTPFKITDLRIRVWESELPFEGAPVMFLNMNNIRQTKPLFDMVLPESALMSEVAPSETVDDRFEWLLQRLPGRVVLWDVDFEAQTKGHPSFDYSVSEWDELCHV